MTVTENYRTLWGLKMIMTLNDTLDELVRFI